MDGFWEWLAVDTNREMLAWIGGALAVVASGWWTAFTFFRRRGGTGARPSDRPDRAGPSDPSDAKRRTQRTGRRPREDADGH